MALIQRFSSYFLKYGLQLNLSVVRLNRQLTLYSEITGSSSVDKFLKRRHEEKTVNDRMGNFRDSPYIIVGSSRVCTVPLCVAEGLQCK